MTRLRLCMEDGSLRIEARLERLTAEAGGVVIREGLECLGNPYVARIKRNALPTRLAEPYVRARRGGRHSRGSGRPQGHRGAVEAGLVDASSVPVPGPGPALAGGVDMVIGFGPIVVGDVRH